MPILPDDLDALDDVEDALDEAEDLSSGPVAGSESETKKIIAAAIVEALTDAEATTLDDGQYDADLIAGLEPNVPYILVRQHQGWQRVTLH